MGDAKPKKPTPLMGVGMPQALLLEWFGKLVYDAFGDWPYLVGTAATGKAWRDVDVRLLLPLEEYRRCCGEPKTPSDLNLRWTSLCLAYSVLGQHITGLPIDFQIQEVEEANRLFPGGVRHPLIAYGNWTGGASGG